MERHRLDNSHSQPHENAQHATTCVAELHARQNCVVETDQADSGKLHVDVASFSFSLISSFSPHFSLYLSTHTLSLSQGTIHTHTLSLACAGYHNSVTRSCLKTCLSCLFCVSLNSVRKTHLAAWTSRAPTSSLCAVSLLGVSKTVEHEVSRANNDVTAVVHHG